MARIRHGVTRRRLLISFTGLAAGSVLAACATPAVPSPVVQEKVVTQVVEVEKQVTQLVEVEKQVTQVVEKEVTQIVEVEKEVTQVVEKEVEIVVTATPQPREAVEIVFWWGWDPEIFVRTFNGIVEDFQAQNPDVKVTTGQHGWGAKLLTAFAAGTPPDLYQMQWGAAQYAVKGVVTPLDQYLATSSVISKDTFPEAMLGDAVWRGQLYGLPAFDNGPNRAYMASDQAYASAGLSAPEDIPDTHEDLLVQAQANTKLDAAGNIELLWWPGPDVWPGWLGMAYGSTILDEANENFTFGTDPNWKAALQLIADYRAFIPPEKSAAFDTANPGWAGQVGCAICVGKQAVSSASTSEPGLLAQNAPEAEISFVWYPTTTSRRRVKTQLIGGHLAFIPAVSNFREQAWRLAEIWPTIETIKKTWTGCGFAVWTNDFIADPGAVVDLEASPGMEFFVTSMRDADEYYSNFHTPIAPMVWDEWNKGVNAVIFKEKSIDQALADMQTKLTEEQKKVVG